MIKCINKRYIPVIICTSYYPWNHSSRFGIYMWAIRNSNMLVYN